MDWLKRRWFLVGLIVFIPAGILIGFQLPPETLLPVSRAVEAGATSWMVAIILFLMSFSLDSRQIGKSLRSPGPVLFACLVNAAVVPLLAWPLMRLQLRPDFSIGLMIAATVPCTMATASVWTRKAGGNDAVSLLVTMITNGLCFLVTPLWLNLATASNVEFDLGEMMRRLVMCALLPATIGQLVRLVPAAREFSVKHKPAIGAFAQAFILVIVFTASLLKIGPQLHQMDGGRAGALGLVVVWGSCILVHLAGLWIGWKGGGLLGLSRGDRIAIAFAGSQKTLPIGLLVATHPAMFGDGSVPLAIFPMLMYHVSQLFLDTAFADRWRTEGAGSRE